jgi:Predicted membrane protein (DUF2243)
LPDDVAVELCFVESFDGSAPDDERPRSTRMDAGRSGLFNLVERIVDHHILRIHHVGEDGNKAV